MNSEAHQVMLGLCFTVRAFGEYLQQFIDNVDDEYLPDDPHILFDWAQNLRFLRFATSPIEYVLEQSEQAIEDRASSTEEFERLYTLEGLINKAVKAFGEGGQNALAAARVELLSAAKHVRSWSAILSKGNTRIDNQTVLSTQILLSQAQRFPSLDHIRRELGYAERQLIQSVELLSQCSAIGQERLGLENQSCMDSRRHYLVVYFVVHFALTTYPQLWELELHRRAIQLHDRAQQLMELNKPKASTSRRVNLMTTRDMNTLLVGILSLSRAE